MSGLRVRDSVIAGKGLFTKIRREKGDFICTYDGDRLTHKQYSRRYKTKSPTYVLQVNGNHYIDGKKKDEGSYGRYINSCSGTDMTSNCKFCVNPVTKVVSVKATKDISKNEEILVSYGRSYNVGKKPGDRICIIGGGLSGLYAAYVLMKRYKKKNYDITIYERDKEVLGGRIKNVDFAGMRVVAGAGIGRYDSDVLLRKLCDDILPKDGGISIYDSKSLYVGGIKRGFNPLDKIKGLIAKSKTDETTAGKTFKQFAMEIWKQKTYDQFVSYVGETDFEEGDVLDILNDYNFEESFSSEFKAFGVDWDIFLEALIEKLCRGGVRLKCGKNIENITKLFEVDGEEYDKVIIATPIESTKKLLLRGSPLLKYYDNVGCQSFTRVYAKLEKPLDLKKSRTVIAPYPFQKIIEFKPCVYMISYSDNKASEFWKSANDMLLLSQTIEKELVDKKLVVGGRNKVLSSKLIYWDCGTHYYKPLDQFFGDRDEYLKVVQNPMPNVYVVGEAFSRNQGWCEGALESVEAIIGNFLK